MADPAPGKIEADRAGWFVRDYFPSGVAPMSKILFDAAGSGVGIDFAASGFTDGILIDGICGDAIHISGANTVSALHISGDQATAILVDVDAALATGISFAVDTGITMTTGIDMACTGTGTITTAISLTYTNSATECIAVTLATGKTIGTGMSLSGAGTYTTGLLLDATAITTGITISAGSLTDGISISGTTPVDGLHISSACSANGINISGACADGIEIGGDCTAAAVHVSGNQVIGFDCDWTDTLDTGMQQTITTAKICTTGLLLDGAGTFTTGISISATAVTTGISISAGSLTDAIKISGTTPADGIEISSACSSHAINISGAQSGAGITIAGSAATYGVHVSGATPSGLYVNGATTNAVLAEVDSTSANNSKIGINISKDLTNATAAGALGSTNQAINIASVNASSASASGVLTVSSGLIVASQTNSTAVAQADVYNATLFALTYSATTTTSGTATSSAKGITIDYDLTETAGTLSVDDFSIFDIDFDTTGTVSYLAGTYNAINVNMADAGVPTHAASTVFNGLQIDASGLDVSDSDMTLSGIKLTMPGTYGAATEYALYASGDGTTVALCSDAAAAITVGGTVTTGLSIGAATTGIDITGAFTTAGISISDITSMEGDAEAGIKMGSWGTPLNTIATMADNIRLFQGSAQCVDGPASGYKEVAIFSGEVQTDGAHDLTYVDFSPVHTKVTIDKVLGWCYGIQSDVTKSDAGAIDDCYAMTAYFNTTGGPTFTTSGRVAALSASISASGGGPTITGEVYAAWIANRGQMSADAIVCFHNQSAATVTEAILMDLGGTVTQFIQFNGTICDAWTTADQGATGGHFKDEYVKIPVKVVGVTPQLYILAAETWAT